MDVPDRLSPASPARLSSCRDALVDIFAHGWGDSNEPSSVDNKQ